MPVKMIVITLPHSKDANENGQDKVRQIDAQRLLEVAHAVSRWREEDERDSGRASGAECGSGLRFGLPRVREAAGLYMGGLRMYAMYEDDLSQF